MTTLDIIVFIFGAIYLGIISAFLAVVALQMIVGVIYSLIIKLRYKFNNTKDGTRDRHKNTEIKHHLVYGLQCLKYPASGIYNLFRKYPFIEEKGNNYIKNTTSENAVNVVNNPILHSKEVYHAEKVASTKREGNHNIFVIQHS